MSISKYYKCIIVYKFIIVGISSISYRKVKKIENNNINFVITLSVITVDIVHRIVDAGIFVPLTTAHLVVTEDHDGRLDFS